MFLEMDLQFIPVCRVQQKAIDKESKVVKVNIRNNKKKKIVFHFVECHNKAENVIERPETCIPSI